MTGSATPFDGYRLYLEREWPMWCWSLYVDEPGTPASLGQPFDAPCGEYRVGGGTKLTRAGAMRAAYRAMEKDLREEEPALNTVSGRELAYEVGGHSVPVGDSAVVKVKR